MAGLRFARGLDAEHFRRDVAHGDFGLRLGLGPARAAERVQRRTRLAGAHVFADEMRLADGDVKFRRRLRGIVRGVFDGETFLTAGAPGFLGLLQPRALIENLQTKKSPDAVLDVDDVIAFLELGKINVEQRARGGGVRRLEPARALDFVAPENLRVGDDDEFGLLVDEAARERAEVGPKSKVQGPRSKVVGALRLWTLDFGLWTVFREAEFAPDFLESLPLARRVTEDVDGEALPQPAMQLREELAPLRLRDLHLRRALGDGTEGVETLKGGSSGVRRLVAAFQRCDLSRRVRRQVV